MLLTNAVVAYNAWELKEVVEKRRQAGRAIPLEEILGHIAAIAFCHVNFRGSTGSRWSVKWTSSFHRRRQRQLPSERDKLTTGNLLGRVDTRQDPLWAQLGANLAGRMCGAVDIDVELADLV